MKDEESLSPDGARTWYESDLEYVKGISRTQPCFNRVASIDKDSLQTVRRPTVKWEINQRRRQQNLESSTAEGGNMQNSFGTNM